MEKVLELDTDILIRDFKNYCKSVRKILYYFLFYSILINHH